ncbi:MAG: beta-hexosaminidase [Bacilli bacterium]|nr:beta-hexosaminidase [Bacilli bacterium]
MFINNKNYFYVGIVSFIVLIAFFLLFPKGEEKALIDTLPVSSDEESITKSNSGIFSKFSTLAENKVKSMSLDEKIGQLLLVQYPNSGAIDAVKKYKLGGFVFFEKDFKDKSENEVINMIKDVQEASSIPLLTAVDEEGGSVVRVSSNSNLVNQKFSSPRELYLDGGFELIEKDTKEKSKVLNNLGLNVNLAPVVDVSVNSSDYIYNRTLGENTTLTSTYAKTVISASKNSGVSYVMKHFPGYGNNLDTHDGEVIDNRTFSEIETNDLPPFEEGILAGGEAILVSHNTVVNIDSNNPASLSLSVNSLLRNNLNFTGVIITDDLSMGAVSSIDNVVVKALLAGNDLIMVSDYEKSFKEIKDALDSGELSEDIIDEANRRIISWKYYKGLMYDK